MLAEAGIALVIEPPLPSTYLDGAAMIVGNPAYYWNDTKI